MDSCWKWKGKDTTRLPLLVGAVDSNTQRLDALHHSLTWFLKAKKYVITEMKTSLLPFADQGNS